MFFHIWLTLIWMPKLCSQNPYTAVTIDLIYPLMIFISSWFLVRKTCLRNSLFKCLVNPFVLLSVILSLKNISAKIHYKHYGRIPVNLVHHLYYRFLQLAYVAYLRTPTPIGVSIILDRRTLARKPIFSPWSESMIGRSGLFFPKSNVFITKPIQIN